MYLIIIFLKTDGYGVEMRLQAVLLRKFENLFDFTRKTIKENGGFLGGENANTLKRQITLYHFARAGYLLEAIYTLTTNGFATEGMVLLRSLLNLYINIKWLTTGDTERRFERFADFEVIFKKLAILTLAEQGDIWDQGTDEELDIHDADFENVKDKYGLTNRRDFFNWSGKSIYKMASDEGVNLEKEYKIVYGRLSSIEHTGPDSVRTYLDDSKKGTTSFRTGPRDENVDLVLLTALEYYFHIKAIVHTVFDIKWDDIEKDQKTFQSLYNEYLGENA